MSGTVDLHMHSTFSDGTLSPTELMRAARQAGLQTVALTDHDTARGTAEAQAAGRALGLTVVPGIEMAADLRGTEVHFLGYYIDPNAAALSEMNDWNTLQRQQRNGDIIRAMQSDGIDISAEAVRSDVCGPDTVMGRPHIARYLCLHGYAPDMKTAFDRYVGSKSRYFRPRRLPSMSAVIGCLRAAGGVAVAAHPFQYGFEDTQDFLRLCRSLGAAGAEVWYTGYSLQQIQLLTLWTKELGMLATGGSDFHGANKPQISLGRLLVPAEAAAALSAYANPDLLS